MTHLFAHEASFARDLAFVPMFVRYALDRAGRKIALADWIALAPRTRRELADRALEADDDDGGLARFAARLDAALASAGRDPARVLAPSHPPALASETLRRNVVAAGGSLDDATWRGLAVFDRYALVKLGDRETPSHDFAAALDELGLRRVGIGGGRIDAAMHREVVAEHDP